MKINLAFIALMIPLSAWAAPEERFCLAVGMVAKSNAELFQKGVSEERVLATIVDPKNSDPKRPKQRQEVINQNLIDILHYVYTVHPSPDDARKLVYLKCMNGGLGYIDWSKQPAAARR